MAKETAFNFEDYEYDIDESFIGIEKVKVAEIVDKPIIFRYALIREAKDEDSKKSVMARYTDCEDNVDRYIFTSAYKIVTTLERINQKCGKMPDTKAKIVKVEINGKEMYAIRNA